MRTVNFLDSVVYGMAYLLGVDPTHDLLKDHARAWVSSINTRVRYAWELWDWPELMVTEERAFRQVWYTDVDYQGGQGENSEVYYIPNDTYYRVIGNPPVGTIPPDYDEDAPLVPGVYFEEIPFSELDRYLAYSQNGKQDIGQIYGIYNTSPRTATPAIQWATSPSGYGIDLPFYNTGTTVWITYKPGPPQFSSITYETDENYSRGDVVLDLDSGNCYIALAPGMNNDLDLPAYWLLQEFPYIFSEYVKYAAASDQSDDLPMRDRWISQADDFLAREMDKCTEAGQIHRYGPKLPYRMPLGLSGYASVYWSSVTP